VLDELLPSAWHHMEQYANNPKEADHGQLKRRLRPTRELNTDRTAQVIIAKHAFVQKLQWALLPLTCHFGPRSNVQVRPPRADEADMETLRGRRWDTGGVLVLLVLGVASVIAIPMAGPSGSLPFIITASLCQTLWTFVGLGFAIRTALLKSPPPGIRRAWRMLLPAYALWVLVAVCYAIFPGEQFPSPPDVVRVLVPVATLVGILAFARLPDAPAERVKLGLDAGLVAVGTLMMLWYLVLSPAFAGGAATWHELVPSVVHPLSGAAMAFVIVIVLMRGPETAAARRPLHVLVAATVLILITDTQRAYVLNHGGTPIPTALQACGWTFGIFLLALAPYVQAWYARRPERYKFTGGARSSRPPRWPYLTVLPGYVLLMVTVGVERPFPEGGLIAGAFIATTLVFARQMVAAQESRRLAVTDGLTGLANRVQLYEVLPRALARAARNGTHVGVLVLDMNGFKQINDSLGHQAGDQLLVGFGWLLRQCVLGSDLVARLGGDEFAIVLPDLNDASQAQAVIRRIRAAMGEPIDLGSTMVQPSASIGVALSEPGDLSSDDVLNRADLAMYETKRSEARA
jgi:diguanylate cyclase (GGDEF)-like protein